MKNMKTLIDKYDKVTIDYSKMTTLEVLQLLDDLLETRTQLIIQDIEFNYGGDIGKDVTTNKCEIFFS